LVADAYGVFVVMATWDYSSYVTIRAPSNRGLSSADEIRVAIRMGMIVGMGFRNGDHWDSVDLERARHLLADKQYARACVNRVNG